MISSASSSVELMDGDAPPDPPCWPAFGRRRRSSASPFGRLLNHQWAGGRCPPEPLPAPLERFALSVVIIDNGVGGAPAPRTPPAGRPSAGGESRAPP